MICPLTATLRDDADQFRLDADPSKRNWPREADRHRQNHRRSRVKQRFIIDF
ncbi:MAG: hypothetical protein ACREDV_01590 [Methylocella sp.]